MDPELPQEIMYTLPPMRVKQLRWLFIAAFSPIVILGFFVSEPLTVGVSAEWTDGRYRFAAGTMPWALPYALLLIGLYILLMYAPPADLGQICPACFAGLSPSGWISFLQSLHLHRLWVSFRHLQNGNEREFSHGISSGRLKLPETI